MINRDEVYRIGKIAKAHGLKGEVVFAFDDDVFDRDEAEYLICEIDGILVPFFIEEYRFRSDSSALMKFEDIDSVEQTERLLGCDVFYERERIARNIERQEKAIPESVPEENEDDENMVSLYFFVGFTIQDGENVIGKIASINDCTENWLFVTEDDTLIPANEDFIVDIDYEKKIIIMDLPLGLLDLNKGCSINSPQNK